MHIHTNPEVEQIFDKYPSRVRKKLMHLRALILLSAGELDIVDLEETLKWGEPSYLTKKGSTIRIDWKKKNPDQYAMYFKCTSKLVPAFRAVYQDVFDFEGNRAIIFQLDESIPEDELKSCIKAGLQYHLVKQQHLLGL